MRSRLELQAILEGITKYVYFQQPSSHEMKFPCIRYELDDIDVKHADNVKYSAMKRYTVTVIDKDPDSVIPDRVSELPYTSFSRHYTANNLHHTVYQIYY